VRTFDRPSALAASMLVDVYLPEMSEIELCMMLTESCHALPAILITDRSDAETRPLMEEEGEDSAQCSKTRA
jgi:FixJ family two-component response regulator